MSRNNHKLESVIWVQGQLKDLQIKLECCFRTELSPLVRRVLRGQKKNRGEAWGFWDGKIQGDLWPTNRFHFVVGGKMVSRFE